MPERDIPVSEEDTPVSEQDICVSERDFNEGATQTYLSSLSRSPTQRNGKLAENM